MIDKIDKKQINLFQMVEVELKNFKAIWKKTNIRLNIQSAILAHKFIQENRDEKSILHETSSHYRDCPGKKSEYYSSPLDVAAQIRNYQPIPAYDYFYVYDCYHVQQI